MNDQSKLDPRYDPAFQRGYSGEVRTTERPHGVLRASTPTPAAAPRPASPTGAVPPAAVVPAAEAAEPVTASAYETFDDEPLVAEPVAPAPAPSVRTLMRNPFLGVLALLGAALAIAGGSWALSARSMMMGAGSFASERDYWFVQAALVGAPVLAMTGVAILAGVGFVFANAWNRSR